MGNDQAFQFRIRVGDVEIEASGPHEYIIEMRAYADQLISSSLSRLKTMGAVSPPREPAPSPGLDSEKPSSQQAIHFSDKDESLVEFLERLPNRTHQEKILAFGYFLEKNRSLQSFGVKEVNDCYDEVKEAKSNTAQYLALLLKSGLIMKSKVQPPGSSTQYVLTRKGEATIKEALGSISQS